MLARQSQRLFFFNKNRTFSEETTSVLAGGREKLEEDPGSKVQTNNKLNPHKAPCKNRTQGTLVESKRSHHCVISAHQKEKSMFGLKYVHLYLAHKLGTKFRGMEMYWGIYDPSFLTQ